MTVLGDHGFLDRQVDVEADHAAVVPFGLDHRDIVEPDLMLSARCTKSYCTALARIAWSRHRSLPRPPNLQFYLPVETCGPSSTCELFFSFL
jgi:hypothetical protein